MDPEKLRFGLIYLVALILSICVHEFGHAFVADKLGDPLPRSQGRVTLNPIAHIDPIGTLLLPIVAVFTGPAIGQYILGWGKPVQISLSPRDITRKISIRTAHALVAIAGPEKTATIGRSSVPTGSMCASGLSVTRPCERGRRSPSLSATKA